MFIFKLFIYKLVFTYNMVLLVLFCSTYCGTLPGIKIRLCYLTLDVSKVNTMNCFKMRKKEGTKPIFLTQNTLIIVTLA